MKRQSGVALFGIGLLLLMAVVPGIAVAQDGDRTDQAPPVNGTTMPDRSAAADAPATPRLYTVTAESPAAVDRATLATYGRPGTRAEARIEVRTTPANASRIEELPWAVDVSPALRAEPAQLPSDDSPPGVGRLHEQGVTGEGVSVGVIDSYFEPTNQEIGANVVDTVSFSPYATVDGHGTSVAEVVARTAPDSDITLAKAQTGVQFEAAISYLAEQDVDVIVLAYGIFSLEDDGEHFLTDDVDAARENGTLVVVSAGNERDTHWEGQFRSPDGDEFHEWSEGDEMNCVPDCTSEFSGEITATLRWEDDGQQSEYRLRLYNPETGRYLPVENYYGETGTNEYTYVSATVQSQPLRLVVERASGAADDEIELVVSGATGIETAVAESSLSAPADVASALTVAAYEPVANRIAPYSSQGPTDDGRVGVDLTGYTDIDVYNGLYGAAPYEFSGTSAAAPYVGGVAALIEAQRQGDQSPAELRAALRSSSEDVLVGGPDIESGAGVLNASAAVPTPTDPAPGNPALALIEQDGTVAFPEVLGVISGFNGDGTYTQDGETVAVGFQDVLGVLREFNARR
jgi:hypothetical protein